MNDQSRYQTSSILPEPFTAIQPGILQRKCKSCGNHTVAGGKCDECQKNQGILQRKSLNNSEHQGIPLVVNEALHSSGQPLGESTRAFFEPYFAHDFSHVRVHSDTKAAESADAVDALAYTVNSNIVFGKGSYSPGTLDGKRLLAHELVHVVQQHRAGDTPQLSAAQVGRDAQATVTAEQEAEEVATAVEESASESEFMGDSSLRIFRKPKKGGKKSAPKAKPKSSSLTASSVKSLIDANNNSSVSSELLLCLIWKESSFDPNLKNAKSTATGLMQMTQGAVQDVNNNTPKGVHFTHSEMTNATKNIQCGTYYLKMRIDRAKGNVTKGLEGYGTGSGYAKSILECETCIQDSANTTDDCLKAIHP
jgi:hypothetical protein